MVINQDLMVSPLAITDVYEASLMAHHYLGEEFKETDFHISSKSLVSL